MQITRCKENPIVTPGVYDWRKAAVFNPGVLYLDGKFLMYERAAGSLMPFVTSIGLLESEDGVHFQPAGAQPIFTGEMLGYPQGSVEDARVVKIGQEIYMCYALQPYAFDCHPTGYTLPEYVPEKYPQWKENDTEYMITRSGIAVSKDGRKFEQLCYTTPAEIDDRDNVLFPEKINGKFALLRRPMQYVGKEYGTEYPGIWISYSEDLTTWSAPKLVATSENPQWEGTKIGAAATPLKTEEGWLLFYHGVDQEHVYRVGAMLLDLKDPAKVIGRSRDFVMEPETYYEKHGLVIPNTVFPTSALCIEGMIYLYYGCCDTCISMAQVPLEDMMKLFR